MKKHEINKYGVTVIISYDPTKTTDDQLKDLIRDAEASCIRIKNKRGY